MMVGSGNSMWPYSCCAMMPMASPRKAKRVRGGDMAPDLPTRFLNDAQLTRMNVQSPTQTDGYEKAEIRSVILTITLLRNV